MTRTATARQGDTLDLICWRELGTTAAVVEQAYELNRGLAESGPVLPEGATVIMPDPPGQGGFGTAAPRETVNLWD